MSLTRQMVIDALLQHPKGLTNVALAAHFNTTTSKMATRMKQHYDSGHVTRVANAHTPSGIPIYTYTVAPGVTPSMYKAERLSQREPDKKTVRAPLENDEMAGLVKRLAEGLASQISAQVMVELHSRLQHDLASIIPTKVALPELPALIHPPAPSEPPREKKHKVLVMGLLPQQAGLISQEFGDVFSLNFWKNESHSALRNMAGAADTVMAMAGFVSHADVEAVEAVRKAKPAWVNGGMTSLRTALTELYVREQP